MPDPEPFPLADPSSSTPSPPSDGGPSPEETSELSKVVTRLIATLKEGFAKLEAELAKLSPQPSPPNDGGDGDSGSPADPGSPTDPATPTDPDPDTPTEEPDMPIVRPDFAHAHARISIDGDKLIVEKSTGIQKESVRFATDAPEGNCHEDSPLRTSRGFTYAPGSDKPPRNTRLVRMSLADDHKIDPTEVVVLVTAADRETAYRHDFDGFSVSDGAIDAVIRDPEPDVARPKLQARLDVVLLRIG